MRVDGGGRSLGYSADTGPGWSFDRLGGGQEGARKAFEGGLRVTDRETMDVVEMVLGGQVNKEVVELINQSGGKAVGLTGQDGAFIRARKMLLPSRENGKVDIGQVGEIESIDFEVRRRGAAENPQPAYR